MNILLVDDEASALRDLHRVMKPADPEEVKKALLHLRHRPGQDTVRLLLLSLIHI